MKKVLLMVMILCIFSVNFTQIDAKSGPSISFISQSITTVNGSKQLEVKVKIYNINLFETQFMLGFDPNKLQLADPTTNKSVSTLYQATEFKVPKYNSETGNGWLSIDYQSMDNTKGTCSYILGTDISSWGGTNGADSTGRVKIGSDGLDVLSLYFKVADGAALTKDSVKLLTKESGDSRYDKANPSGVILIDDPYNPVTASDSATVDLSNVIGSTSNPSNNSGSNTNATPSPNSGSSATTPASSTTATSTTSQSGSVILNDISDNWAKSMIEKFVSEGKVSGYPDQSFKPNNNVTRAEFVVMCAKILNISGDAKYSFSDIEDSWAKNYIGIMCAKNYINGYNDGSFKPNTFITREEVASIIGRIEQYSDASSPTSFTDSASIGTWASNYVNTLCSKSILSGYPDGSFMPKNNATRAEVVSILYRVLNASK